MAVTVRLITTPRNAATANASSVQAAKSTPRLPNSCIGNLLVLPSARNGLKYQLNNWLNRYASTVSVTPSRTSLTTAQRTRPQACVHANRNVPLSSSLASTGAPTNTPSRIGTASRKNGTVCALMPDDTTEPCWVP